MIEGDSLGVVHALNGDDSQIIWTSKEHIIRGRSFAHQFPPLSFRFVPRIFNLSSHKLAHWASSANFSGHLPPSNVLFHVLQDQTDTPSSVTSLGEFAEINEED